MTLSALDWGIILGSMIVSLLIGLYASRSAGRSSSEFFLSGRNMPWWLLGVSMVATTFAADTPNLVAQLVREQGVAGNWGWWAFLLTGMLTTFVYARLWRRSGVMTDLEFYELRYSGELARWLRGFRALYLGFLFNVLVMATVCLAGIKLSQALLGLDAITTLFITAAITLSYSLLGGLRGVVLTDFFQFGLAIAGSIGACVYVLGHDDIGGLTGLLANPAVQSKMALVPAFDDPQVYVPLLLVPLAVQWWASWYPGAEPGGGGYIAQRMLAAKNDNHALGATLLFNVAHYALRPWPWILIALASLVLYPELDDLAAAFPDMRPDQIKEDLGYPVMLRLLPAGLLGLVVASLLAALMSTLSTHLNWGASYLVNDLYVRFFRPDLDERGQVVAGRVATALLMVASCFVALQMESALDSFQILLQIGAGTGLIFILRWLWWRINAYSELTGMIVSFVVAVSFALMKRSGFELAAHWQLVVGVVLTTIVWIAVTLGTRPTDPAVLNRFVDLVDPPRMGWAAYGSRPVTAKHSGRLVFQLGMAAVGVVMVYAALFGVGKLIYGQNTSAVVYLLVALVSSLVLYAMMKRERQFKSPQV